MLVVSDALKNAFMQEDRHILIRLTIGSRVFDNNNVFNVEYDSGSLAGDVFAIGSTYSNSIKVTFSELVEGLNELDEVVYEIGIEMPDGTVSYVPMGTFIINATIKMDRNNYKTSIDCMDKMVMLGGTYSSSLAYPAEIRQVALEIANKAGVAVDTTSFSRLSADKIGKPEGYTYREAIGLIAQFEAGFATFNRYGKLEIRTLVDPTFTIPPDNYISKGLDKNEVFFRLGGIKCTTENSDTILQAGNTAGNQITLENRVMTKTLLDKIYLKIQTINYYPFSLSWFGNPILEAGDWIEVEDLQGNKFKTPNLSYSLSFSGGLTAKSSAETSTQSDAVYGYKSPLQQQIEFLKARIDAAGGNVVFEGIDTPTNAKEGDLWFKLIGPDVEILIYKKDANGVLSWVKQISTADMNIVAEEVNKIIEQADADRAKALADIEAAKAETQAYVNTEIQKFDIAFDAETGAIRNEITTSYTNAVASANQYTQVKANEFNANLATVQISLNQTITKADNAVLKANQAVEDVGFLKSDVATAKSNATIALSTAQTSLNNSGVALSNAQTALDAYNNLEIGGRNLLLGTTDVETDFHFMQNGNAYRISPNNIDAFLKGGAYTVSVEITDWEIGTQPLGVMISYRFLGGGAIQQFFSSSNTLSNPETGIITQTFILPNMPTTSVGYVEVHLRTEQTVAVKGKFRKMMMTKGNKAVDWSPNPEDVQVQITAINGELATKVSQTTFNTLSGTVGTHATQISQTQTALTAKAESSVVNTIKGTVDTHTTQIKVTSDGLALKADSSLVNTIKGTVDTHSNQISANSTAINARLTSTQVETLLTGKKYVNETTLNATSSGLTAQITQVSTDLSNLEIGGRNLLENTSSSYKIATFAGWEFSIGNVSSKVKAGDILTIRIYLKPIGEDALIMIDSRIGTAMKQHGGNVIKAGSEGYSTVTMTVADGYENNVRGVIRHTSGSIPSASLQYKEAKLEKGNKFTDWTPAPEDMATLEKVVTIEANIDGIQATVANKANQSQVTQLAGQITSLVSSTNQNIATNGTFDTGITGWVSSGVTMTYNGGNHAKVVPTGGERRIYQAIDMPFGTNYNIRFRAYSDTASNRISVGQFNGNNGVFNLTNYWKYYEFVYEPNSNNAFSIIFPDNGNYYIDDISVFTTGAVSSSQITQLSTLIQTKVESSTYTSKMTQLDNAINLRVVQKDVTDAILSDKTIKDTRATNELPSWYNTNYPKQTVEEFKQRTTMGVAGSATYGKLETKVIWNSTSGGAITQIFSSSDGVFQRVSNSAYTAWLAWDKIAEAGQLISQINLSTEGILLQGKRIQLDGDVTMTNAFITRLDTLTLTAVYADIATLKTKMLTADVITSTHLKVDNAMMDKLTANTAVVNYLFTKTAFVDNLNAKTLTAVTANIATIRSQVLVTNSVTATHVVGDTAMIDNLFATTALIDRLTTKSAFIANIKAIDIAADRITAGTLNAALVNIINLNASKISTGTITGANSAWNLNTGIISVNNPTTGDVMSLDQGQISFKNGAQGRYLRYQSEGLRLLPHATNTGTSKNTALHLIGGGSGSYQYIQFASQESGGINMRLEAEGQIMTAYHGPTGSLNIAKYGEGPNSGLVLSGAYETRHSTGVSLRIAGDSISTPRDGARNIYLTPQGVGSVVAGNASGVRYNMVASDFVKQSSRATKTFINPLVDGLTNIRQLQPVSYQKIDKLNQGIYEIEKGFIAEDSPNVATVDRKGIYDSHITAYLVLAIQELDTIVMNEIAALGERLRELENRLK